MDFESVDVGTAKPAGQALLPLRRYRVFGFACVTAVILGLVYYRELPLFAANMQDLIEHHIPPDGA